MIRRLAIGVVGVLAIGGLLANGVAMATEGQEPPDQQAPKTVHVGQVYEITRDIEIEQHRDGQSSGSSTDIDTLIERVIAVDANGFTFEYDLPPETNAQDRAREWQFPARIFRPFSGFPKLLNTEELENRVEKWLKSAKLTRQQCGHWYFTWNAFKVECDPQSTLKTLARYDLSMTARRAGMMYQDPLAAAPTTLKLLEGGKALVGEMQVDPDIYRRGQAESDLVTAEIMGKHMTLEDALKERSKEKVAGTLSVIIDADASGFERKRTTVINVETTASNGEVSQQTSTIVLSRKVRSDSRK